MYVSRCPDQAQQPLSLTVYFQLGDNPCLLDDRLLQPHRKFPSPHPGELQDEEGAVTDAPNGFADLFLSNTALCTRPCFWIETRRCTCDVVLRLIPCLENATDLRTWQLRPSIIATTCATKAARPRWVVLRAALLVTKQFWPQPARTCSSIACPHGVLRIRRRQILPSQTSEVSSRQQLTPSCRRQSGIGRSSFMTI